MNRRFGFASALLVAGLVGGVTVAQGSPLTVTTTGIQSQTGSSLAASATFDVLGSQLIVTLDNTSTDDVRAPADILQAIYWNMAQNVTLSLVSATTSSECDFDTSPVSCGAGGTYSGNDLTGKYAYSASPTGIGSAGLNAFGGTQGMAWGILSAGDNLNTYNGGMTRTQHNPFVKHQTQFTLDISKGNGAYSPSTVGDLGITDVKFNYGTSAYALTASVPAPSTLALMPLAVGLMGWMKRRQRRSQHL
ncbi:MAG: PEP-CTERM sorting domain-containing protein [Gammaproteobacteria bacterium]